MQQRTAKNRQSKQSAGASAQERKPDVRQEISGLLLAAAGVWFILALSGRGGGILGDFLSQGLRTLAGLPGAWATALLLVWLGVYLIYLRFHQRAFVWSRRTTGLLLLLLGFELLVQLWQEGHLAAGGDLENARQGLGGGLIGYAIAVPLTRAFGTAGRWVVLVAAFLIGLVLNTEITLGTVVNWVKERLVGGAREARGAAGDLYRLMTARSERPDLHGNSEEEPPPGEEVRGKRRLAATEALNTIGERAPSPEQPVIRVGPETAVARSTAATGPARVEPVIRRPDPHPDVVENPQERPARNPAASAAGPTGSAGSGRVKESEIAEARLVPDRRGQLGFDPERLGASYQLPSIAMLPRPVQGPGASKQDHLERAELLERTLRTFGVEARVIEVSPGPAVTRYELQPGEGVRVAKFSQLTQDLALALAAEDIRIEAPIPGKAAVGIEVPNRVRQMVPLREVMETPAFQSSTSKLTVAFGKDNAGNPVVGDLSKMPHMLIAGSTGAGKSVCMNTIICSVLFKSRPDEVKMLMIDPKMVELSTYNGIPHLIAPVITDVKKAAGFLKGAVKEMENRYELFAASGVKNLSQYNQLCLDDPGDDPEHPRRPLPFVLIFIDELADLMMVAPVDVEDAICRLAQMARACGMHLVIATQSPRVDVITGLIKANIPSRIAFAVSSQVDSRVIMDYAGAERLLGRGDMLYHPTGYSKAMRAQGAFIAEKEVDELVRFVKAQGKPVFTAEEVAVEIGARKGNGNGSSNGGAESEPGSAVDAVFPQAVRVVVEHGQASVSILQRRLRCNYNKAARLIDMMEERGFIGPHQGSKPREVLLSMHQWQELFKDEIVEGEGEAE